MPVFALYSYPLHPQTSGLTSFPAKPLTLHRGLASLVLWQASGLQVLTLGRCLWGEATPRAGMSSDKGPLCLPTCCPAEHIPFLSAAERGTLAGRHRILQMPSRAPCLHSNSSFLDRCGFRWPFLQVA